MLFVLLDVWDFFVYQICVLKIKLHQYKHYIASDPIPSQKEPICC